MLWNVLSFCDEKKIMFCSWKIFDSSFFPTKTDTLVTELPPARGTDKWKNGLNALAIQYPLKCINWKVSRMVATASALVKRNDNVTIPFHESLAFSSARKIILGEARNNSSKPTVRTCLWESSANTRNPISAEEDRNRTANIWQ